MVINEVQLNFYNFFSIIQKDRFIFNCLHILRLSMQWKVMMQKQFFVSLFEPNLLKRINKNSNFEDINL